MDQGDETADEGHSTSRTGELHVDRFRALLGVGVVVVALGAAAFAIYGQRHSVRQTLDRVGLWPLVGSFLLAAAGVGSTCPMWHRVLKGLDVDIPWRATTRVFFISQLGKYLPGSIWPAVMQMEAGRARGANRRTMLSANLITVLLGCAVGLVMASLLLPFYDASALSRYWWVLLALPLLVGLLHPRALPFVLDRVFALLRRPPLRERLDPRAEMVAAGWSVVSWLCLGGQLFVLCAALGHGGLSAIVLCVGGMALAYSAGVLFIPAPAGAGVRDIILKLILGLLLGPGPALTVVIASRVLLIACDIVLAGLAGLLLHPEPASPLALEGDEA